MSIIDELLKNNATYANRFSSWNRPVAPRRHLAIVACMDSRMDIHALLGLEVGDAHVIRNAGGIVTDDVIRSLVISQRKLETREIVLIHHTNCGLETFDGAEFAAEIESETGRRPPFEMRTFTDVDADVRESIERLKSNPYLLHRDDVRGFVYDVNTGKLREVL